jgi:hypothetical protein
MDCLHDELVRLHEVPPLFFQHVDPVDCVVHSLLLRGHQFLPHVSLAVQHLGEVGACRLVVVKVVLHRHLDVRVPSLLLDRLDPHAALVQTGGVGSAEQVRGEVQLAGDDAGLALRNLREANPVVLEASVDSTSPGAGEIG